MYRPKQHGRVSKTKRGSILVNKTITITCIPLYEGGTHLQVMIGKQMI